MRNRFVARNRGCASQRPGTARFQRPGGVRTMHFQAQNLFDRKVSPVANDPAFTNTSYGKQHLGQGRSRIEARMPLLRLALLRSSEASHRMPEMRLLVRT